MKKLILIAFTGFLMISCSKNDDNNPNCNFLLDVNVNYPIYLNLNQDLLFTQSPIQILNVGNGGIVVMKTIGENYVAWDNADPNHQLQSCSTMTLQGTTLTCTCDDENKYDINTGLPLTENLACGLKPYFVEANGNIIRVFNN